jgi:Uma2 family endonuclease
MVRAYQVEEISKRFHSQSAGKITLNQFLAKYRKGKNGIRYEWNNGIIEKTDAMTLKEQYIVRNLQKVFYQTEAFKQDHVLTTEVEVWTTPTQWRKPDMAYLTEKQIEDGADGIESVPLFVVEIISQNDNVNTVFKKVGEYFKAGVKILWQIFPDQQMVQVFHSLKKIETMEGNDECSAESVIKGFKMTVNDIFQRKGDNKSDN